jgi:2-dehydro-3-deoxyphosphogluconate aldolase/(4S)-4-hydroxy-2-oxoglutarate aldolase
MSQEVLTRVEKAGIIPIVVIDDADKALPLGRALLDAGLDLIEITMRTESAMQAMKILVKELPELLVGAGTIFSLPKTREALAAGARFIVSPHLDEEIVTYCVERDVPCVPGVFTPSEVQKAISAAMRSRRTKSIRDLPLVIKIFPASTGGPTHIKAMRAVFPEARFLPLGGVDANNLADYLEAGAWAVGGTWICKRELIQAGNFSRISDLAQEALHIIREARK